MPRKTLILGSAPAGETPVTVGESEYAARALRECQRYLELVRRAIGPEPDGAKLRISRSQDLDPYSEVVVEYDDTNTAARAYAIRCDREAPTRWEGSPDPYRDDGGEG